MTCKNPFWYGVPLVKQTWLCKKKGRYVALENCRTTGEETGPFEVVQAPSEKGLGFNPSIGSKGGSATCHFSGTVADSG